ncbi:hypothetical protein CEUSTIGMA_g13419.t1 [Chlamydomonas eustigma]|uniref:Uncharacterized protein n=1 Tax=Chlamydomonas eustigma TaxID=1157962 RepID=A0A250XSK9_9CHLO|nr:hypothetical protein CEUSTIGMA_g13419.t1 [Chlamydomonas eustigma]|eukprot:GAX86003.1 hypothetical protein CEUSTIGMA_g13419.t1 [Chlamydomonas eustigma]
MRSTLQHVAHLLCKTLAYRNVRLHLQHAAGTFQLHTGALAQHGSQVQDFRAKSPSLASTTLRDDISLSHLLQLKPSVNRDIIQVHRSSALERVQDALKSVSSTGSNPPSSVDATNLSSSLNLASQQEADLEADHLSEKAACQVPELHDLQKLPVSFLMGLIQDCQLDVDMHTESPSVGMLAEVLYAFFQSQKHKDQQDTVQTKKMRESKLQNHAVWRRVHTSDSTHPDHETLQNHKGSSSDPRINRTDTDHIEPASRRDISSELKSFENNIARLEEGLSSNMEPLLNDHQHRKSFSWGSWGSLPELSFDPPEDASRKLGPGSISQGSTLQESSTHIASALGLSLYSQSPRTDDRSHSPALMPSMGSGHPYAPVYDQRRARQMLYRDLLFLLRKKGFKNQHPNKASSLLLLPPSELAPLAEECGLPSRVPHHQLASSLADLACQMASPEASTAYLSRSGDVDHPASGDYLLHTQSDFGSQSGVSAMNQQVIYPRGTPHPLVLPTQAERVQLLEALFKEALSMSELMGRSSVSGGDAARRHETIRSTLLSRAVLAAAVHPIQVASWLTEAHASEVLVFKTSGLERGAWNSEEVLQQRFKGEVNKTVTSAYLGHAVVDAPADTLLSSSWVVLATAPSQRQVYVCGEAVRVQARASVNVLKSHLKPELGTCMKLPCPTLVGGRGMDWVVVDAGPVTAHVLTYEARKFYDLEELLS